MDILVFSDGATVRREGKISAMIEDTIIIIIIYIIYILYIILNILPAFLKISKRPFVHSSIRPFSSGNSISRQ